MAVIAFPNIEPQGSYVTDEWELRSITARHVSPLSGVATTLERPGAHWAVKPKFHNLSGSSRARMQQLLANFRGHAQRAYLPLFGWTRRGSFSAPELLTNNAFASGTTGWEISVANEAVLTASDGILRATRAANTSGYLVRQSAAATVTQYAPYAARALTLTGTAYVAGDGSVFDGSTLLGSSTTASGLATGAFVPSGTTAQFGFFDTNTGKGAGHYLQAAYTSLARCALVDNAPNLLLRSDAFDHAAWTKSNCTATADNATAPNGTTTGDGLTEDSANSTHFASQSVTVATAAADYSFSVAIKAGTRTFAWIAMTDGTDDVVVYVNLSTGALGVPSSSGANFTLPRAFSRSYGFGWYVVTIVGRKASASTTVTCRVGLATALGTASYLGDGASFISVWRGTLAQSSVPTRLRETTTAATTGELQTGGALYLKGLPASTNGLLLQGDPVEVITGTSSQLVRARSTLNSDEAGVGHFELEAPIRVSPSDNAAVIVCNPLCRMMLDDNVVRWSEHSGGFSDVEFAAVEDTYP